MRIRISGGSLLELLSCVHAPLTSHRDSSMFQAKLAMGRTRDSFNTNCLCSVLGMPKEKYDPPDPRRMYTIMSSEEAANGKKSYWAELEISGEYCLDANDFNR